MSIFVSEGARACVCVSISIFECKYMSANFFRMSYSLLGIFVIVILSRVIENV